MVRRTQLLFLAAMLFIAGCKDEFRRNGMYDPPSWLKGKLYTQILTIPELSTFARCIKLTGYDSIINVSGSYTVFAPNNAAFNLYFQAHPNYTTVDQIPVAELTRLVKFHIIQDPWSSAQLEQLDVFGWIDSTDLNNNVPKGYKRQTLLRENNRSYGIKVDIDNYTYILDSTQSTWHRRQYTDSRKYAPIFYKKYFDAYHLNVSDYSFYFNRPFENAKDIYYVGGKIITPDIFAENGFIQVIDRVVDPLLNAYQILSAQQNNNSYTKFRDLADVFPSFTFDVTQTNAQPGAHQGYLVDSLFDISYPNLTFSVTNELTNAPSGTLGLPSNVTIRYQYGLVAPTNAAMDAFVSEYLAIPTGWGNLDAAPYHIKRMIVNTHMSNSPIYATDIANGFVNGEKDLVILDQSNIIQKQYGSNCTFIGTNKMIVPRAFKSVAGPIYLQRGYSIVMYAIEASGLLPALKRINQQYMFFAESDPNLRVDSSLVYYPPTRNALNGGFAAFQISGTATQFGLSNSDLRTLLLNHIGVATPKGIARKEFIQNLAGNFLIVNNQTKEVSGTAPTTVGYKGLFQTTVIPTQISTNADNGKTYDISHWFNFAAQTLFVKISTLYPKFHSLLQKAGLSQDRAYRYTFISDNSNYTVFVPNDSALAHYNADTISLDRLKKFCLMHFVQGNLIFTDGNLSSGYYQTARIDESSTSFTTIYTKIYIEPGTDVINFPDKAGNIYLTVNESALTNIITGRNLGTGTEVFPNVVSNGVIHEINKVLLFNILNTSSK